MEMAAPVGVTAGCEGDRGERDRGRPRPEEDIMKVGIGADHGDFEMKQKLIDLLNHRGPRGG
jgi:hypothetical protein